MTDRVIFAFDKHSARSRDADGRMRVKNCVLSTAEVNPYRGNEIPGWQNLGLDPNHVYELYRDPDELAKGAPTFEGNPLMIKHIPQTADDPKKEWIGGSVHSIKFDGKQLRGDLLVMDGQAIDLIESGEQSDLSCGYRYLPDMTSRIVNNRRVDGTMRNIQGNHVALVDDGRASDAHVADHALQIKNCGDTAMNENMTANPQAAKAVDAGTPPMPAAMPVAPVAAPAAPPGMAEIGAALKQIATLLESMQASMATKEPAENSEADKSDSPDDNDDNDDNDDKNAEDADPSESGGDDAPQGADDFALEKPVKEGAFDNDINEGDETELPKQAKQEGASARGNDTPIAAMDAANVRKYAINMAKRAVESERRRNAQVSEAKRDVRGVLGDVYGMDNAGQIYREALKTQGVDTSMIPKGMAKIAWQSHVAATSRAMGVRHQSEMAMDSDAIGRTRSSLLAKLGSIKTLG